MSTSRPGLRVQGETLWWGVPIRTGHCESRLIALLPFLKTISYTNKYYEDDISYVKHMQFAMPAPVCPISQQQQPNL